MIKNVFISNLHLKDVDHFTSNAGLYIRRKINKPFRKLCNIFTNANILKQDFDSTLSDDEYFNSISYDNIPKGNYALNNKKNNIVLERYPELVEDEPYIFVCNHTCPEDIETVLNIIDRNAYLVLGSIESLKYKREMYLLWLNGMIPFDILDTKQRREVFFKMKRVVKTNSILIFPEGSHNYNPNKIVNNLYDGVVNLALETGRKVVVLSMLRDNDNKVSYIDASNPIDFSELDGTKKYKEALLYEDKKKCIKELTTYLRDKMGTAVLGLMSRHAEVISRNNYDDLEEYLRDSYIRDAFKKLKWEKDVFEAEYLTKKTIEEKEYEDVNDSLSNLVFNDSAILDSKICTRDFVLRSVDSKKKDIVLRMREHLKVVEAKKKNKKILKKI